MPNFFRAAGKCAALLILLWSIFVLALTAAALIPRDAIRENLTLAAEYYKSADMFEETPDGEILHHYADAVLLNIIANHDPTHPFASAMRADYYVGDGMTQGQNLAEAVIGGAPANTSYARYWHGMTVILTPLLFLLPLGWIKPILGILLAALIAVWFVLLFRRRLYALCIGSAIGLVICHVWIVPMCIEYYACFFLMFLFADVILLSKNRAPELMFLTAGALTCFFDFLTCEVLTLGVPLVVLLALTKPELRRGARISLTACCAWLGGYAATWLVKWLLAAAVTGTGLWEIALAQGAYRMTGELAAAVDYGFAPTAAIVVNLSLVFPFSLAERAAGILTLFFLTALGIFCVWFLFRRKWRTYDEVLLYLFCAAIPFARWFVVANHAALHPFFTYRSIFVTVIALAMALAVSCELPQKKKHRVMRK